MSSARGSDALDDDVDVSSSVAGSPDGGSVPFGPVVGFKIMAACAHIEAGPCLAEKNKLLCDPVWTCVPSNTYFGVLFFPESRHPYASIPHVSISHRCMFVAKKI